MKRLLTALVIIVVLLGGGIMYVASKSSGLMKHGITTYGPDVLGASVTLEGINVSLLSGSAQLEGLVIGNPSGFKSDYAFSLKDADVKMDVMSVFDEVIVIDHVVIDGASVIYDMTGKGNNFEALQKNIDAYVGQMNLQQSDSQTGGKPMMIKRLSITGTDVGIASALLANKTVNVGLPNIEMENIGTKTNPVTGGEVAKLVMDKLSSGLKDVVSRSVVQDQLNKLQGDIQKEVEGLKDKVEDQAKDTLNDKVKDLEEEAKKKLKDIF